MFLVVLFFVFCVWVFLRVDGLFWFCFFYVFKEMCYLGDGIMGCWVDKWCCGCEVFLWCVFVVGRSEWDSFGCVIGGWKVVGIWGLRVGWWRFVVCLVFGCLMILDFVYL